jgi:hypothetical protein
MLNQWNVQSRGYLVAWKLASTVDENGLQPPFIDPPGCSEVLNQVFDFQDIRSMTTSNFTAD